MFEIRKSATAKKKLQNFVSPQPQVRNYNRCSKSATSYFCSATFATEILVQNIFNNTVLVWYITNAGSRIKIILQSFW